MAGFFQSARTATRTPLRLIADCNKCGFYKKCRSPKMKPTGKGRRKILIVGDRPGEQEDKQGKQFVGGVGRYLADVIRKVGYDMRDDCTLTNALICFHPNDKANLAAVPHCQPNLIATVNKLQPDIIIPLGGLAVKSLLSWVCKEEPGEISKWVGYQIPSQMINAWICPSWNPSYLLRSRKQQQIDPVLERLFEEHIAGAFALESKPWSKLPDYKRKIQIVYDTNEAARAIDLIEGANKPVAFDYETNMLKPDSKEARIFSCAVSNGDKTIAYLWRGEAIQATQRLLQSDIPKIGYNCFSGDVKFLTHEYGVVSLGEMVNKSVTVFNHKRQWVPAVIRSFGKQQTVETSFSRRNYMNTVRSTFGHSWIMVNGDRRTTAELKRKRYSNGRGIADSVSYSPAFGLVRDMEEYRKGLVHGIVLGDGTRRKDRSDFFQVRLCGAKRSLLYCLKGYAASYPSSYDGDPMVYVTRQQTDLKDVPNDDVSDSYLIGFFRGLLATDGTVAKNGQIAITNSRNVIEWCERFLPKVGYLFQGKIHMNQYHGRYPGSFDLKKDVWTAYLSRESVGECDCLLAHHLENYKEVDIGPYKFSGLGETREEEVFCAVVPDGNSFTLEGGLVTGNCKFEERWTWNEFGHGVNNWSKWNADGMINAHILDNRNGVTGLKFQAFVMFGIAGYEDEIRPFLESTGRGGNTSNTIFKAPVEKVLLYNGMDALLEYKVHQRQLKEMQ